MTWRTGVLALALHGLCLPSAVLAMGPAAARVPANSQTQAQTQTQTQTPFADATLAAIVAQLGLPPVAPTREVIGALPALQAAKAGIDLAQARAQRLQAGVHEWALKAGVQQRSETAGDRYVETDLALERGVRLGQKAQTDQALGAMGVNVGQNAYADLWHETVRTLVQAWFEARRQRATVEVLTRQNALAQSQLRVAQRRVRAGEAARLDEMMAQAEAQRAAGALAQALGRLEVMRQELRLRYPGLALDALAPSAAAQSPDAFAPNAATHAVPNAGATNDTAPGADAGVPAMPETEAVWLQRIVTDNHEMELAQAEAQQARLFAQRAQLDTRADPLVGVRAARERGGSENIVGLYFTVPLTGALRQADARAAQAQADAAEQRLAQTKQRVEAAAQRAVLQASHTRQAWERQHQVAQAMARVAQLSAKAYALGEVSLTESLQAQRQALEAGLAAQSARWEALEALTRLLVDAHQLWSADEH